VLTLREFERRLALDVLGPYHNEIHTALRMPPIATWRERAPREPRLPADRGGFYLDFLPNAERCVGREGVRLFNIHYQDGALAHLIGAGAGRLRVKYDPRDLSVVFVELPSGEHVRVPYADMGRPPITLWEHRRAERALRDAGRRSIDEHAIFAAVAEMRRQDAEATRLTRAARREAQREVHAAEATGRARQRPPSSPKSPAGADPEARVPSISDEDAAAVEFWS
jgi:putative transposase